MPPIPTPGRRSLVVIAEGDTLAFALPKSGSADTGIVVALDESARVAAEHAGWTVVTADSLWTASEGDYWAAVDHISRSWFRPHGTDLTMYNDVSLGDLIFFELGDSILYSLIRRVHLARAIADRFAPTEAVLIGSRAMELGDALARAAITLPVVSTMSSRRGFSLRSALDPRVLRLMLRRAGIDRVLRAIVFRLGSLVRAFPDAPGPADRGKVFAVVDIPTGSIMDTLAPVVRRLGPERAVVLTTDPRAVAPLRNRGLETRVVDPTRARWSKKDQRAAADFVATRWRTLDAKLSEGVLELQYLGVDLWPLMRDACRRLFLRRLPWAIRELAATRALLSDVRPSLILTASDSHYAAQIFTVVGMRLGIPSLSLQHGAFGQPFGYLPVRASVLGVWGPAIRDWCLANGVPDDRVAITGQPRFDTLLDRSREVDRAGFLSRVSLAPDRPTVLFAPESLSSCPDLARWMTAQMISALGATEGVQVLVRPHPSDSEQQHRGNVPPELASRMVVSRHGDVAEALTACDVVVLGQSTLGLEAMIVDRPVIMLLPEGGDSGAVPYAERGAALRATSADGLRAALRAILDKSESAARLREGARAFVEGHHVPPPQSATANVVRLIDQLVSDVGAPSGVAA